MSPGGNSRPPKDRFVKDVALSRDLASPIGVGAARRCGRLVLIWDFGRRSSASRKPLSSLRKRPSDGNRTTRATERDLLFSRVTNLPHAMLPRRTERNLVRKWFVPKSGRAKRLIELTLFIACAMANTRQVKRFYRSCVLRIGARKQCRTMTKFRRKNCCE